MAEDRPTGPPESTSRARDLQVLEAAHRCKVTDAQLHGSGYPRCLVVRVRNVGPARAVGFGLTVELAAVGTRKRWQLVPYGSKLQAEFELPPLQPSTEAELEIAGYTLVRISKKVKPVFRVEAPR